MAFMPCWERPRLLPAKKELLSLLKWAGVSLQLVNLLNCDVWHNVFGKRFDLSVRVMPPNQTEISHGRVSWQTRSVCFAKGPLASSAG